MFKMVNSKKGFTLVELMIVVGIMAILVAVAIPLYGAVTRNAQKNTCSGNRREILAQVGTYTTGMNDGSVVAEDFSFTIEADGENGKIGDTITGPDALTANNGALITSWFQELPYCPAGGTITVTYTAGTNGAAGKAVVSCGYEEGGEKTHI